MQQTPSILLRGSSCFLRSSTRLRVPARVRLTPQSRKLSQQHELMSHQTNPLYGKGAAWAWGCAFVLASVTIGLSFKSPPLRLESLQTLTTEENFVSSDEIQKHISRDSAWVVLDNVVYDVTGFVEQHPGGEELLLEHLGKDISPLFNLLHASTVLPKVLPRLDVVGTLAPNATIEVVQASEDADEVEERRDALPEPYTVINLGQFEKMAKEVLGEESRAWKFFSSFADDGETYFQTKKSFSFLRFIPRVNVPVSAVETSTSFLNSPTPVPVPLFMSPTGASANGHPDGELNHCRASSSTGIPQIVSTMSSIAFTDLAEERDSLKYSGRGEANLWWQLYIMKDRKESERRIREVAKAGAKCIVITVDVAAIGKREADTQAAPAKKGSAGPASPSGGVAATGSRIFDANMTWDDIAWVKQHAPGLPVLVKGLGSVRDVELAKKYGASGVVLSNHGGRQLNYAPPPLATLVRLRLENPALLEDPTFEVYIDGGVRRGTDVLKALCLGAKGVGLGRAMLYAQTCYGSEGIVRATQILTEEIQTGMRLLGARSIADLKPEMVELLDGLVGRQMKSGTS